MAQEGHAIAWDVQTHTHRERSTDWYWGLGVAAMGGAALAVFFGNVLFAAILVIGGACIGILASRGPREHTVRIDNRGVSIDGTLYRFDTLRSFWVDVERDGMPEGRNHPHLYLSTSSIVAPHFSLPLESAQQAQEIREFLHRRIREEEQSMHFGEAVAEMFGL